MKIYNSFSFVSSTILLAAVGGSIEYRGIIGTYIAVYPLHQLEEWLQQAGYEVEAHCGIHNVYGYIDDNDIKHDEAWHEQVRSLELTIVRLSPYRDNAVFTHIIAWKA
ncbi:hypothetical protein GCM10010912_58300 [Paenibacillus albidus]|uniref:Uncharacterized protein n=1 Tax=Paenibacillus albidus TaxID=2041023 RepID=A0A917FT32_9BACL|nr:hypothetical protein [Paenibacillus albidus]GGG05983.1 hypothetical protein GCM10010912_58300 [Paenibacillus albidus]